MGISVRDRVPMPAKHSSAFVRVMEKLDMAVWNDKRMK
jgi:hypothetical protein